jgi:putative ABC transport system permease protein
MIINDIIDNESVSNAISQKTMLKQINEVLSSLDSVIVILILSSSILAFIILYNLSNINISERKREISTLKVLGFYDEEVDSYITRENYFITIVGILLGIFMGGYISHFVIKTCEPHDLLFLKQIKTSSYIISALIASCFTIIVSFITHHSLKKIDMIESLKSNE